ncbi:hypothetical protein BD770DRAFT_411327 [Pilaira anomala]|nr:hypothetical protein BD770DRAFT_411327 [Pilaira anomala]
MPELPFEILLFTFSYLSAVELLQCQLTNKRWYEASVELLYSNLTLNTGNEVQRYVRTISNSSRLGSYLKSIDTDCSLWSKQCNERWDEYGLLDAILLHCPNVLRLESKKPNPILWVRLSYAATQGQLSRLQQLPTPTCRNLEPYLYTALSFRNTLTTLHISDEEFRLGPDLIHLSVYQTVCNQISEFPNLQILFINFRSDKELNQFDALIEKCQRLKHVSISLTPTCNTRIKADPGLVVHPRPDIQTLECNWETIDNEEQLRYVMRKFPNLKNIKVSFKSFLIEYGATPGICPTEIVFEFLQYIIRIPKVDVAVELNQDDLNDTWNKIMDMTDKFTNITIAQLHEYYDLNAVVLKFKGSTLKIKFPLENEDEVLPYLKFLSKSGNRIRSLTTNVWDLYHMATSMSNIQGAFINSLDWILNAIQLCPLLQELTLSGAGNMPISVDNVMKRPDLRHRKLKKLTLDELYSLELINCLRYMSFNFPNLRQLHLGYSRHRVDLPKVINVVMPDTALDLLTWTDTIPDFEEANIIRVFIKLKTGTRARFYLATQGNLLRVTGKACRPSPKEYYFNIVCKGLNELRMNTTCFYPYSFQWKF